MSVLAGEEHTPVALEFVKANLDIYNVTLARGAK
jgi:hypothetical protein